MSAIEAVREAEERLRIAALNGDVAGLDALMTDDLVFVDVMGRVLDKQADLDLHRTGALKLSRLSFADLSLRQLDERTVHTLLRVEAEGTAQGAPLAASLRFTRLWRLTEAGWRVTAIHSSAIA